MFFYRFALTVLAPFIFLFLAFQCFRGKETLRGLSERLGKSPEGIKNGKVIWVHGASIGEIRAARTFLYRLLDNNPDLNLVVTMNTYTAQEMVQGWKHPKVTALLAPMDFRWTVRRFLGLWSPELLIVLENEIWPNRMVECRKISVPIFMVGSRMSKKTLSFWQSFPRLKHAVFDSIGCLVPLDITAREAFVELGLDQRKIGPNLNLKSSVELEAPDQKVMQQWSGCFVRRNTLLAASTHDGEDETVLAAFEIARKKMPDLRLIIAPRHPGRAKKIAELVAAKHFEYALRSSATPPGEPVDVLLADSLGEMAVWYSLAFATFVGGTLANKGGHTPFEPVQFNSVVIHGPNVENHAPAFSALAKNEGALKINDAQTMAAAVIRLADKDLWTRTNQAAKKDLACLSMDSEGEKWIVEKLGLALAS